MIYEYAGFQYNIRWHDRLQCYVAHPVPGQHSAANKEKHCRAAVECWENDGRPGFEQRLQEARELARRCLAGQGHSDDEIERVARKIMEN